MFSGHLHRLWSNLSGNTFPLSEETADRQYLHLLSLSWTSRRLSSSLTGPFISDLTHSGPVLLRFRSILTAQPMRRSFCVIQLWILGSCFQERSVYDYQK